jgi:putative hydrolase of the HAD superfamily
MNAAIPPALDPAAAWPRPSALLLDAMGTLITLRRSVGHTYAAVAAEHGLAVEAERIDQVFPALYRSAPPLAFPGLVGDALRQAECDWWGDRIEACLRAATDTTPGQDTPRVSAELRQALFERFADPALWRVYDDVPAHLAAWHGSGLRLAVVSNFDSRLDGLLEGLDLARWLELVIVSSRAGAAKPSPDPFLQALDGLNLPPEQAWHVGDSPEDRTGAQAAGLRCLLVRRR